MSPPKQEIRWVLAAQSGDREALDRIFRILQAPLYRCLKGILGDAALAEDVLQEVFVLVHRKIGWLREPELLRPWAYRIATREAFRWLRRERRWAEQVRDEGVLERMPAPPPREPVEPELLARLPALVAGVSPASRAVLVLHYLEDMPLREVARVLGVSLGTVKSRLAYGLEVLRRRLS
jgi:RNA polymerase sigma-70 factor (ECF subfamily)